MGMTTTETSHQISVFDRARLPSTLWVYSTKVLSSDMRAKTYLLEHAVLVADAVAPPWQVQRGHGVDEARCQAPQPAIAQRSVLLSVPQRLQVVAQLLDGLAVCTCCGTQR